MKLLSIIIPVYNVEKYIRTCLESIFRQDLDEDCFEVIIVNDGTKDGSITVIQDLIDLHKNIIVHNQENQGISMARNNGMQIATGEYILFVDSDDLLLDNSLSYLLTKAIQSKADIIYADFIIMNDDQISQIPNNPIDQKDGKIQEKTGNDLLLQDLNPNHCFVWRSLFRKNYLINNNLKFIPNIYYEDVPFIHESYILAKYCLKVNWYLNIYRKGHESITNSFSKKKGLDFCIAIARIWNIKHQMQIAPNVLCKLQQDIFTSFSVMMCSASHTLMMSECREIIAFLFQQVPDLKFTNSKKQRITSFLVSNFPNLYVLARHVYGKYVEDIIIPFYRHKLKNKI